MCSIYKLQFYFYTICIHIFTLCTYVFYYSDYITNNPTDNNYIYDYIIVGSGTAGSLIAHRIATETNFTYILLEAGGPSVPILDVPVIAPLLHSSIYDWQYKTVPQDEACLAMVDKKCSIVQGKIAGGSAKLNNMVHFRGNISQYIHWFHGRYNHSFFKQHIDYIEKAILPTEDLIHESELADTIIEAAKELGFNNINLNFNNLGLMKTKVNQRNGQRWSTYHTLSQNNHNILTNAYVEQVIIKDGKALGVKFNRYNQTYSILAKKAVVISAGAINSPKILQLSGIGPADMLKKLSIPVKQNLPVGKNLLDHITTGLDLITFNKSLGIDGFDLLNPFCLLQYFISRSGPLTFPGCEAIGFFSTNNSGVADIQFMVLPVGITADRGSHLRNSLGITNEVWNNYFVRAFSRYTVSILPILLHPKSKGEVLISSSDPKVPPSINPNYFKEKEDLYTLVKGLQLVFKFVQTKAMKNLGAEINNIHFPGCQHLELFTKDYWECYIRHLTLTSFHPVGTCKMGLPDKKDSVVDTYFNVIGIKNLYVVDSSVLPELPIGNVNTAIAMIANIFFEINLKPLNRNEITCHKIDLIHELLFKKCYSQNIFIL